MSDLLKAEFLKLFRFGCNCGFVLGVKLVLNELFVLISKEYVAYFLVQICIFFISYFLHSKFTFKHRYSLATMWGYLKVMIGFLLLDYGIYLVSLYQFGLATVEGVLITTLIVFFIRFFFVRRIFTKADS